MTGVGAVRRCEESVCTEMLQNNECIMKRENVKKNVRRTCSLQSSKLAYAIPHCMYLKRKLFVETKLKGIAVNMKDEKGMETFSELMRVK